MSPHDPVLEALRLFAIKARERLDRHPYGHLLEGGGRHLSLSLVLPLSLEDEPLIEESRRLAAALDEGIDELLAQAAVFQPGKVLCLRCRTAGCEHSAPGDCRSVFTGYGPSGVPRFLDFGQLLLDRHDPRVDSLFQEENPPLLAAVLSEAELTQDLLSAFKDPEQEYRILGGVAVGFYRVPDPTGHRQAMAITLLVVSTRYRRRRPRLGLNILGAGPGGEPLDRLHDRLRGIPWLPAVRWGQAILSQIEVLAKGRATDPSITRRVDGLLRGLARRVTRVQRARERRTLHAEERHEEGTRPTRMAILDLSRAEDPDILFDPRRKTLVVLGERGRAHFFNLQGKLVTSVRYSQEAIERRRQTGFWRPSTPEERAELRRRSATSEGPHSV